MVKGQSIKGFAGQMPAIKIIIPDELDYRFRDTIYKSKGMKRGNIKEAIKEAIEMWISAQESKGRE